MRNYDASEIAAAEARFAKWVEDCVEGNERDFEVFAAETPELEPVLRRMRSAWGTVQELRFAENDGHESETNERSIEFGYELLEVIGHGGFGRVHRGRDRALGREVAIKVVDARKSGSSGSRQRFIEEARTLAKIDHTNVVRVFAVAEEGGEVRLVLELLRGRTLADIVRKDGVLGAHEAARIGIELCRALAAIHALDLVHLDVKPGNVMRVEGGRIVLLDFGFARDRVADALVSESPRGGTPPFMAPESLIGAGEIGARADVYGLGATLYWCTSGGYPFKFETQEELFDQILTGTHVPLVDARPDIDPVFAEIVAKAMRVKASDRYASAGAFEQALRSFVGDSTKEFSAPPTSRSNTRRNALLGLLATTAIVAGAWTFGQNVGASGDSPPTVVAPFGVQVRLFKGEPDRNPVELALHDTLGLKEEFFLRTSGSEPYYLYVFDEDMEERMFRMFPMTGDPDYLPAGREHHAPSGARTWRINQPGQVEHIFVVASAERVPWIDELLRVILPAPTIATGVDSSVVTRGQWDGLTGTLRGVGVAESGAAGAESDIASLRALFDLYERELALVPQRVVYRHYELVTNDLDQLDKPEDE